MKRHPAIRAAMAAMLLHATTGCSLFAPWKEEIVIDSDPQGAEVIIPGQRGVTPCTLKVPCNKDLTVIVKKKGYYTGQKSVQYTLGKCGVLDVAGTWAFLIPAIGLASPGAYTLREHEVIVVLSKIEPERNDGADVPAPRADGGGEKASSGAQK